jgi:hypothetical protein
LIEAGSELLAIDLIESINNILKPIAEVAIAAAQEYAAGFSKGFRRTAKKKGSKDGEKVFIWLRRFAVGAATSGSSFSGVGLNFKVS